MPKEYKPSEVKQGHAKKFEQKDLPNSSVFSDNFWERALAIFGHLLAIYAVIWGVIMLFAILATIGS